MKLIYFLWSLGMVIFLNSCSDFLEIKPNVKLVVPKKMEDAALLLNDYTTLNMGYPTYGELGTDDYFITDDNWESVSNLIQRNAYHWVDEPYTDAIQWQRPYKAVYVANQVLDLLSDLDTKEQNVQYNNLLGVAHFFRAFAFHQLTEVFCPVYVEQSASNELGIPLRLSPDITEISPRASLQETYVQIIDDYRKAIANLPKHQSTVGHPSKAAAYGGLARFFLDMGHYADAYRCADSSLMLKSDLLNFNELGVWDDLPIPQFNEEVLFPAMSAGAGPMGYYMALVDTTLYKSYAKQDLRKKIFFLPSEDLEGKFNFKGNYGGSYSQLFVGLTTSEIYLIKAESGSRIGKTKEALETLNVLLKTRWKAGEYLPITENDPELLLPLILQERRKELLFRGRRWTDLKRLNLEERFKKTLHRSIGGLKFTLEPNSLKYAFRLSETVVNLGQISQNKR